MTMPAVSHSWSEEEFQQDAEIAIASFRETRIQEPLEQYLEAFDVFRGTFEDLVEKTVDLTLLRDVAAEVLVDQDMLHVVRYLASPPIASDDLKVVAETDSLAPGVLGNEDVAQRVVDTVLLGLDRNRFPWVAEEREPTEAERGAAALATAAMMAVRRVMTDRANAAKTQQEQAVADRLIQAGCKEVERRTVHNINDAPSPGEFCAESLFGSRKADKIVRLWDGRVMPVECKVSNSSTNSIKRLNNDAAVKAKTWTAEFGNLGVVPTAVLAGVFKLKNLVSAQADGLSIYWAHNLDAMVAFIEQTRP